jgi:hypothetical protein
MINTVQNSKRAQIGFEVLDFPYFGFFLAPICFGFRYSDFEILWRRKPMRIDFLKKIMGVAVLLILMGPPSLSLAAQDKPADNMQILRDKIKADKKLVVASNMELTESEAKDFWPIYDQYQKDLQKINQRIANVLEGYAADFRGKSLTDEKAKKLIDEAVAIEQAEANLKSTYAPKLSKVLPVKKVARYLQIENKIRAVVKYDLAQGVPLVR